MKHFMCIKIDLKYSSYHRTKKNALINKFKGGGGIGQLTARFLIVLITRQLIMKISL